MSKSPKIVNIPRKRVLAVQLLCVLGVLLLVLIAWIGSLTKDEDTAPIPISTDDSVVAMVNKGPIYQSQIDIAREYLQTIRGPDEEALPDDQLLDYVIQQRLLAQAGQSRELEKKPRIRSQIRFGRDQVLADAQIAHYLDEQVSDDVILEYYETERRISPPRLQIRARQVVVPDFAAAIEIIRRLDAGESFASLALAFSIDRATREAGGDLGFLNRDMLDPLLSESIFKAQDGVRLAPFETPKGWHVVEVMSRRTAPIPSFEERRGEIEALLRAQKIDFLLSELKQAAGIEIIPQTIPETAQD